MQYNNENTSTQNLTSKGNTAKKLLFILFFVPFIFIYLQQAFKLVKHDKISKLDGDIVLKTKPELNSSTWFKGDYQDRYNDYLNENFGFRNLFVRSNNQIRYSLFNVTRTKEVIIGKNDNLFIQGYVDALNAVEFIGDDAIADTFQKIKFIQDELKALGKTFLIVMAPSKARIYKEFLPESYLPKNPDQRTNYNAYTEKFKAAGINFIDFNALYKTKKEKTEVPLFPQLGAHWSRLEAIRAIDTILGHLSYLTGEALPEIEIKNVSQKNYLESPDDDIVKGMNLLFTPAFKKMLYPEIKINTKHKVKKNALVIGDSFWWDIYLRDIPKKVFSNNEFWYYCKEAYGNNILGNKPVASFDMKRHFLQNDLIIVVCAESNYGRMGFGFFTWAVEALKKSISPTHEEFTEMKNNILNNTEWLEKIRSRSITSKITLDSAIHEDVLWAFNHYGPVIKKLTVEDMIKHIRNNKEWFDAIKKNAESQKIDLETFLRKEATTHFNSFVDDSPGLKLDEVKKMIEHTPEWMNQVKLKASEKKISLDSMITLDAIWYIDNH